MSITPASLSPPSSSTIADKTVRILMAEDEPVLKMITLKTLKLANFQVQTAVNGEKALEDWYSALHSDSKRAFDLILMDINMPVLNGMEATQKIREIEAQENFAFSVPIIAYTSNIEKNIFVNFTKIKEEKDWEEMGFAQETLTKIQAYAQAGFTAVLGKPSPALLAVKINELLQKSPFPRNIQSQPVNSAISPLFQSLALSEEGSSSRPGFLSAPVSRSPSSETITQKA